MEMSGAEQAVENPAERPGGVETEQMRSIAEQNAESFLKEFFSFNKDDRRTLLGDIESVDEQGLQGAVTAYYNAFVPYTEQACIEEMASQRIPLKYDRMCGDWIVSVKAKEVSLEEGGSEVFVTGRCMITRYCWKKKSTTRIQLNCLTLTGRLQSMRKDS